jgi:hypothetical protein
MIQIDSKYALNGIYSSNQISIPSDSPTSQNKIPHKDMKLYLGPGYTNLPGATNLFFAPYDFYQALKAFRKAHKINDVEGMYENGLRTIQAPISFGQAALELSWFAISRGMTFLKTIQNTNTPPLLSIAGPVLKSITAAAFILCAIEGIIEAVGLIRSFQFYRKIYPFDIENLKSELSRDILENLEENIYLTKMQNIRKKYFHISAKKLREINHCIQNKFNHLTLEEKKEKQAQIIQSHFDIKKNKLVRRVHPWLADEIEKSLTPVIEDLRDPKHGKREKAKEKAAAIFKDIQIQSQKKLLIHTIGLLAVLITIAGLIAGCCACPLLIPCLLLAIGTMLSLLRYYLYWGLMQCKGWNFSVGNCIPDYIKKIYEKIISPPHQSEARTIPAVYSDQSTLIPRPVRLYHDRVQTWNLECAKAVRFGCRKEIRTEFIRNPLRYPNYRHFHISSDLCFSTDWSMPKRAPKLAFTLPKANFEAIKIPSFKPRALYTRSTSKAPIGLN